MDFKTICEKAYKKEKLDEFANLAEKYAYLEMQVLYQKFKDELITQNEAEKQKKEIEMEFNLNQSREDKYNEVFKKQTEIRRDYHDLIVNIEKSTALEDILDNSLRLIEKLINDNSFYFRNINKVDFKN